MTNNTFKPFTSYASRRYDANKSFIETVADISSGVSLMLDVMHQSYIDSIDEDDGCHPFFHHGHIGTIMLATQRISELLSSEASRIIEWNNRMEELKSKEGVNHG